MTETDLLEFLAERQALPGGPSDYELIGMLSCVLDRLVASKLRADEFAALLEPDSHRN